jgi:membrane-associated phospholipid phosphatase
MSAMISLTDNEGSDIFKYWVMTLAIVTVLASISVTWFDKPIALLISHFFGVRIVSSQLASTPFLSIPLIASMVFVVMGLLAILGRRFSYVEKAILLCDVSVIVTELVKNQLKFLFGRSWPDSWGPNILSLVHDNVYGFHFLHSGESFESFPSGHAAVAAAVMSVLWILYPKLRPLCIVFVAAGDIGLVLLNLHFLSDVIVGSFVGISVGLFTVALCTPNVQLLPSTSTATRPDVADTARRADR